MRFIWNFEKTIFVKNKKSIFVDFLCVFLRSQIFIKHFFCVLLCLILIYIYFINLKD